VTEEQITVTMKFTLKCILLIVTTLQVVRADYLNDKISRDANMALEGINELALDVYNKLLYFMKIGADKVVSKIDNSDEMERDMKSTTHYISTLIHDLRDYLDKQTTFNIPNSYDNVRTYFKEQILPVRVYETEVID